MSLGGWASTCLCVCVCLCVQPPSSGRSLRSKWWIFIGLFPVFQPCPFLCALHCLSKTTMQGNLSCGAMQNGPAEKLNTRGEHTHTHTHTHTHSHTHTKHTHTFSFFLSLSHTHTHTPLCPVVLNDLWPVHYPFRGDKCFWAVCEGEARMAALNARHCF